MDYISRQKQRILATYGVTPIQKSEEDNLEKGGKHGMIGEIRNGYKKIAEGKWKKVSEHGMTKEEHNKEAKKYSDLSFKNRGKDGNSKNNEKVKLHVEAHNKLDDKDYTDEDVIGKKNSNGASEEDNLEKAEGSRGGKVIGHTKSGKPIYQNNSDKNSKHFTKEDHKDASAIHHKHLSSGVGFEQDKKTKNQRKYHEKEAGIENQTESVSDDIINHSKNFEYSGEKYQSTLKHQVEKSQPQPPFGANVHQQQSLQKAHLLQSFQSENTPYDLLEKGGKRATIGEVRTWGNEKWVRHQDGWVHVHPKTGKATIEKPGGKRETASEDHVEHHKEHIDRHGREAGSDKKDIKSGDTVRVGDRRGVVQEEKINPKSLWDNNVLSNRKEIAKDAGCSRDAEYKTWSELDQKDKDILLKYWNIKESLSEEEYKNSYGITKEESKKRLKEKEESIEDLDKQLESKVKVISVMTDEDTDWDRVSDMFGEDVESESELDLKDSKKLMRVEDDFGWDDIRQLSDGRIYYPDRNSGRGQITTKPITKVEKYLTDLKKIFQGDKEY